MSYTAGLDVGSTYAKSVILDGDNQVVAKAIARTGFRLPEVSRRLFEQCLETAGLQEDEISYVIATGFGRHQVAFRDTQITDMTATARAACLLFPNTKTVLDIGGQTMKASRLDDDAKVKSFRLNDKCAAGTGAFIEKTAKYMGYSTEEIGPLAATSKQPAPISGVCAVFAESEVINHLSLGRPPADIMLGAMVSLIGRSVQLMKRVRMEPEYTLVGGILRFESLAKEIRKQLGDEVNVPQGDMVQFAAAIGAAFLGKQRIGARAPLPESAAQSIAASA